MRMAWMVMALVAAPGMIRSQDYAQIEKVRGQAKAAFEREMAREKAGDCKDANTTYAINVCLGRESETSSANYKAFTDAVRALLASTSQGQEDFDQAQAAWEKYSHLQCSAAFDLYKGGTIAPSTQTSCSLMLLRSHMRELGAVYYGTLNY